MNHLNLGSYNFIVVFKTRKVTTHLRREIADQDYDFNSGLSLMRKLNSHGRGRRRHREYTKQTLCIAPPCSTPLCPSPLCATQPPRVLQAPEMCRRPTPQMRLYRCKQEDASPVLLTTSMAVSIPFSTYDPVDSACKFSGM